MAAIRSSLAVLALAACAASSDPQRETAAAEPPAHCEAREFEGSAFTLCRYDPARHDLRFHLDGADGPLRSFARLEAHLGDRAGRLLFAMNGGMYDRAGLPIGLYVEDGRTRRPLNLRDGWGNFHLKPNGVFAVDGDGRAHVATSEDLAARVPAPAFATQSGPMLVIGGELHPRILPDGDSLHVRNGVCAPGDGTAWFAISDEPVSFGRFARLFRDGLSCGDALYLDGSVSSLWDRPAHRRDAYPRLGPLIAVYAR
ncbi:MAG: phosphodiester glycosidase family protein [Allosphingosinicella sp.]|uniref:phosphodiester glycosidase family protein n=1 Tax=Allosphingosinicella sp. TaxID=2823234 RepID=UPI003933FA2F